MARTRTLVDLRSDVCDKADIVEGGTTGRHTTARLNRYVNQAIQKYITIVTGAPGQEWYLARTGIFSISTSTTPDAAGWAPNSYLPLPADFYSLVGVNIIIGGQPVTMLPFDRVERNAYRDIPPYLSSGGRGRPASYRIGGTDHAGAKVLEVIPAADSAYQFEILYIPEVPDLVDDDDEFDGRAGFEEYVVYRAALDAFTRDAVNGETYETIYRDLKEIEKEMQFKFGTMQGASRRVDTGAMQQRLARFSRGVRW